MTAQDSLSVQQDDVLPHSSLRGWTMVLVIALCAAVAQAFGRFSYGLILPAMRDDLGISNSAAGAIGGANVGAYLIGTLAVAWATSRFRLLSVLRFGIVLATAGLVGAALSDSALLLGAALFVAGFGGACVWIPAPMIAADAVPTSRRGFAISLTGTGIGVGVVSASLFAAALRARRPSPSAMLPSCSPRVLPGSDPDISWTRPRLVFGWPAQRPDNAELVPTRRLTCGACPDLA